MRWVFILAAALACCSRSPSPKHLVLVSVDTLRADHLSCYGASSLATPSFDRIAREGVLFENVSTVAPTTLPAHASLFTAVSPLEHRVHDNVGFRLREDLPTLASILKEKGYRTGGFVGSFVLDERFGIGRGFDLYSDEMPGKSPGLPERAGGEVLSEAMSWMEERRDQSFFAFLHFFDPHRPYDPPEAFEPGTQDPLARYRGEVLYVDSLIGRLLAFLEERDLLDSTLVVVTADHGESLGEHGEDTHGFFLYQSTMRVPLLIRGPAVPRGGRVEALARTTDIAPTVLEVLGIEAPAGFEGVSFLSRAGEIRSPEVEAYAETFLPRLHFGWSELRSLRRGDWKLVLAPRSELYDLAADPEESRNVLSEKEEIALDLRTRLEGMKGLAPVRPDPVDARSLASLRALGYLGGSTPPAAGEELPDPQEKVALYNEILELSVIEDPGNKDLARLAAVLEREPRNPRALAIHGDFLLGLDRARDAKTAFELLLEIQSDNFDGRYGLGLALVAMGENDAARPHLEKARELDPSSGAVLGALAALEKAEGNVEVAEKRLREAIALEPNASLYQDLALALAARGNDAGALIELERAARLAPEDDDVEQALANSLSRLGRMEEAMLHYQAILRRSPCYLGALTNLGAAYERAGKAEEAVRSYEDAIRCDSGYANAYRNLGAALARKGDLKRALEVLREAKRLAPEDGELGDAIAELESILR
ncbi:MAG: sulfatase-like hydrolase/transferase [Vicinamibacteria bacterium]